MARAEIYPWSLLTEVGDYFVVPYSFKAYQYMSALVSQRNYRLRGVIKYACEKTTAGSIVMVVEVESETPAHEFVTPEGIMCLTSRQLGSAIVKDRTLDLGTKPHAPKRTQRQIVDMMSVDVRTQNLPWWHDSRTGKVVGNPKVMTQEDVERYLVRREPFPGPDVPYPDYYRLDENLMRRPEEADEEEDFGEHPIIGEGGES